MEGKNEAERVAEIANQKNRRRAPVWCLASGRSGHVASEDASGQLSFWRAVYNSMRGSTLLRTTYGGTAESWKPMDLKANGLDVEQIHEGKHSEFVTGKIMKIGIVRRLVGDYWRSGQNREVLPTKDTIGPRDCCVKASDACTYVLTINLNSKSSTHGTLVHNMAPLPLTSLVEWTCTTT